MNALPLKDQTVLITRPTGQSAQLQQKLVSLGANCLLHPAIEIRDLEDYSQLDDTLANLSDWQRLVFVSTNGVRNFFDRARNLKPATEFAQIKIAAIGGRTAEILESKYAITADLIPDRSNSRQLAKCLIEGAKGQRLLIVRANRGSDELAQLLKSANVDFDEVIAYLNCDVSKCQPEILELMRAGKIDWVTATSSAIAKSTIGLFGPALQHTQLISISPTTSQQIRELGFEPTAEAANYNMDGLVDAMINSLKA